MNAACRCLALAAALAAGVTACSSAARPAPLPPPAAAMAYMRAHPVQPGPGMAAGIVLASDDAGFSGAAARQAGCPVSLTAYTRPAAGNQPACLAWSATVEAASGRVVMVSCGSITGRLPCPAALAAPGVYIPLPGDYVRFAAGGAVAAPADIAVITIFAVGIPAPDNGGWVTAPASGGA